MITAAAIQTATTIPMMIKTFVKVETLLKKRKTRFFHRFETKEKLDELRWS